MTAMSTPPVYEVNSPWEDRWAKPELEQLLAPLDEQRRKVVDILIGVLSDSSSNVRGEAATVLGDRGDRRSLPPLVDLLEDGNVRVRKNAHRALEKILGEAIPYDPLASGDERGRVVKLLRARFGGN